MQRTCYESFVITTRGCMPVVVHVWVLYITNLYNASKVILFWALQLFACFVSLLGT